MKTPYYFLIAVVRTLFIASLALAAGRSLLLNAHSAAAFAPERKAAVRASYLSTAEAELAAELSRKFDNIKKEKYSKKFIFAAVADSRDGRLIYASSPEFYSGAKISPGSIIKVFDYALISKFVKNAAAGRFYCSDELRVEGRRHNCSVKRGHGEVRLDEALYNSCNLYFKDRMQSVPRAEFAGALKKCGFIGEKEEKLILSSPLDDYLQTVIGDGIVKVSPRKLMELMAYLASGESFSASAGAHSSGYSSVFGFDCRLALNSALRRVALKGTAAAALEGVDCAGKTGSATILSRIENGRRAIYTAAVFAGYAPYARPRYAVVTYCDSGTGGSDAACVARVIFDAIAARCGF